MAEITPWDMRFVEDATLWRFPDGRCCIVRDGRFCPHGEIHAVFLGKDGNWHWPRGDVFECEIKARIALYLATNTVLVPF